MARPVLKTAPSGQIVSVESAKVSLRVMHDDDDTQILALIKAAEAELDGYTGVLGRCLLTQTWTQTYPNWASFYRLPFPDVSAAAITYTDADGAEQSVGDAFFEIVEGPRSAELWFRPDFKRPALSSDYRMPVSVDVTAGYGAAEDVPADLVEAIKARVNQMYWGTPAKDVEPTIERLIRKYRMVGV